MDYARCIRHGEAIAMALHRMTGTGHAHTTDFKQFCVRPGRVCNAHGTAGEPG
jgi:hypothetical protein